MRQSSKTIEMAQIAIAVAAMIMGGYVIVVLSSPFAIPGFKFIMMAPYLSMIMMLLLTQIRSRYVLLKANTVFAMIMSNINLFMGLSILLTALLTEGLYLLLPKSEKWSNRLVTSGYAAFVVLTALPVSKYLIGGAFASIANGWILIAALLAFIAGFIGSIFGEFISRRLSRIRVY